MHPERLRELDQRPVTWADKGFPAAPGVTLGELGQQGWNVLMGDLPLPVMVCKETAVEHNLRTMAAWCQDQGVSLAPHVKTSMAPQLVAKQLAHGAWGVTVATTTQARVFHHFGASRILIANQVVDPAAMRWLRAALDDGVEVYTLVDSVESVQRLDAALRGTARHLGVLVEVGALGHRAGARTLEEARRVAKAARTTATLEVAGVETYEAVLGADGAPATIASIDALLEQVSHLAAQLARDGSFDGRDEILLTAGGSAYFDRVAAGLTEVEVGGSSRVVIRSGCYVVHDDGKYHRLSPLDGRSPGGPRLQPALEVWSAVLSRPEPQLAVLGMGKRDVSHDLALPLLHTVHDGRGTRSVVGQLEVVKLFDQHAVVHMAPGAELAVGDLVGAGIDHPCTAFDKWRVLPVIDDGYGVTSGIVTYF